MESKKVAAFIAEGRFFIYRAYCWHLFGAPTVINLKPFNMQIPPPPRQPEDSLSLSLPFLSSLFFFFFSSSTSFPSRTSFNRRCNSYHRERANAILSSNTLLSYSSRPLPHHGCSRDGRLRANTPTRTARFCEILFFLFLFPTSFRFCKATLPTRLYQSLNLSYFDDLLLERNFIF